MRKDNKWVAVGRRFDVYYNFGTNCYVYNGENLPVARFHYWSVLLKGSCLRSMVLSSYLE